MLPRASTPLPLAPFWRRFAGVWLAGLLGVATLALQPIPAALRATPALAGVADPVLRLLVLANPALLVTLLALAGAASAHRVGLRSVLAGTARTGEIRFGIAAVAGLCVAGVLALLDHLWAPLLGDAWVQVLAKANASAGWATLALGVGYGGAGEEVMLRWGLMSAAAWALAAVARMAGWRGDARWVVATAIVLAAALFAAGHLPALAQQVALTPGVVARTLVLNLLAGLVYGWLYARGTLETAMVAHACTHLAWAVLRLVG